MIITLRGGSWDGKMSQERQRGACNGYLQGIPPAGRRLDYRDRLTVEILIGRLQAPNTGMIATLGLGI